MAHRPNLRLRRWLLALMVLCLSSVGGIYGAEYDATPAPQRPLTAHLVRLASLPPVAAAVFACPPDPCVPGNAVGRDFFVQVVERLSDVPLNEFAVDALVVWEPWENTEACWNPLATTQKMDPVCYFNCLRYENGVCVFGVQSYQDQPMGVQATAITLNLAFYNAIRSMLRLEAFDREALRAALATWGTCSGTYCDPLLNTWQDLWDAYVGVCCGCLPASCCSAADMVEASTVPISMEWADLDILPEGAESGMPDERDLLDQDLAFVDDIPVLEALDDLPAGVKPVDTPASSASLAQCEAVEPQRIPPASANYSIVKGVFGSGGGKKASASYVMNSTQGQSTDLSHRSSASYRLLPGYWGISSPHRFDFQIYLPVILRDH